MLNQRLIKTINNPIQAEINIPGSKSITNRALVTAALSDGKTVLKNALFSDDTKYMQQALKDIGINVQADEKNNEITVYGTQGKINPPQNPLYLGNAGTAIRFLTSMVTLGNGNFILTGDERMQERPIGDLVDGLKQLNVNIAYEKNNGYPPIKIKANGLTGGTTSIKGNVSSQYFSSLILSGCYAKNNLEINVIGDLVSKPYIDITTKIMNDFGVTVENNNYQSFKIPCHQIYQHQDYTIEGDASNSSYFFAAAALTGGTIQVNNIDFSTKQGDIQFVRLLEKMGCQVESANNYIKLTGTQQLIGIEIDMNHISDVVQTLAVVAMFAKSKTIIKNVANMRVKETDRLSALNKEITKLGGNIQELPDGLIITPINNYRAAQIETYNDHRMAMAFSLAGLKIPGVVILDPNCVSKTFPDYFKLFDTLYQ